MLTRSPATIPWFVAFSVTAASPVRTPARAWRSGWRALTASTSSSPARTARSASSSWAIGVPQTAMTASPMNFSTIPPCASTIRVAVSKYVLRSSRTASGSRSSAMVVKPTRSVKSTVTRRRSASAAGLVASVLAGAASAASAWPQLAQKRASVRFASPQAEQLRDSAAPQWSQNRPPGRFSVPHPSQRTLVLRRAPWSGGAYWTLQAVARPSRPVAVIPFAAASERTQPQLRWGATLSDRPPERGYTPRRENRPAEGTRGRFEDART